ncbi:MAG: DNA circularization N-terminal domain-containing protein, partial [Oscillospiraceae bacterium]
MMLTPMRYKDYCWPHNPASYSIRYQRKVAVHKVPFGRYCMQDMGLSYRVMQGAGEFVGEGAYDEFRKLAVVFYRDGPGLLTHPVWMTASAYFVSLELT